MRLLLSTIGSRGDVQPLVALALRLRELGHEVRLCVPPDFCDRLAGVGFAVTPVGPRLRTFTPVPSSPERVRQLVDATVVDQFAAVTVAAKGCDIIVAATALQIGARSVAELLGIPYVFVAYCPVVLPSAYHAPPPLPGRGRPATGDNRELWAADGKRFHDLFGPPLNAHRASIGLAPVDDVRGHIFTDQPWLAADPTLGPWPGDPGPTVHQAGAWIVPDDRPLAPELEAFLDAGAPPIYFGFGSMRAPRDLSQVLIGAARALGRRAVVSRGWADLSLVDEQPDCLAVGEVNQQVLFARVAAVVHHGGAGTTTAAAAAGAPQVVIPQLYDQHYWAHRIHHLGIGTAHAPGAPTTDSLTTALDRTLHPDVASQARSARTWVGGEGAQLAAERLLRYERTSPDRIGGHG